MKWSFVIVLLSLVVLAGVALSVTQFTAYLGNDATACNNCHVMDAAYESWFHGSHTEWATCNDCHTPHQFFPKYWVKANSGYHHVTAFVFGNIPVAIRAKHSSKEIIQENCIYCHQQTVESVADGLLDADRYCFECHRNVAHGERGISILPYRDKETDQ